MYRLCVCLFVLLFVCLSVCLFVCRCNNQSHTRVLNLRHVESTFSFFLFSFFILLHFFLRLCSVLFLFTAALHNFCRLISFSLVIASSPLSPSLSLSVSLAALSTWPFSFWATADKQILSFASRIFQLTSSSPSRSLLSLLTLSLRLLHPITQ